MQFYMLMTLLSFHHISADVENCGACGLQCPNAQDYGFSTEPVCTNSVCSYQETSTSNQVGTELFNIDFETPNETPPTPSCNGAAFFAPAGEGIGYYYDSTSISFEEKPADTSPATEITTEILVMNGILDNDETQNIRIFAQDATSVSGHYALGMFTQGYTPVNGTPKDDEFLIHFDASGFNFLRAEQDIALGAIPPDECTTTALVFNSGQVYQQILHIVLAEWQGAPFDWSNVNPLDECIIHGENNIVYGANFWEGVGPDPRPPYDIEWGHYACSLSTNGSTSGEVALLYKFEQGSAALGLGLGDSKYNILDNIVITGSSVAMDGFNTVELHEGTLGNQAHFTLNAGTDGTIEWEIRESDCSAITTSNLVLASSNGVAESQTGSKPSYNAGSVLQVDLHLDELYDHFQTNPNISSHTICCKFILKDAANAVIDQKLVRVVIALNVDMSFGINFSVDSDSIQTETLTKTNTVGGSIVDESGDPVTGPISYGPGDTPQFQIAVPPGTTIDSNTFDSHLVAPSPGGTEYPLFEDGLDVSGNSLNPTFVITSSGADCSIHLNPEFLATFTGNVISMSIEGTFVLDSLRRRQLEGEDLFQEDQSFRVVFSVQIPKKERLSAAASGCIAASIIVVTVGAFTFISFHETPKPPGHPVSSETKSVSSGETQVTVSTSWTKSLSGRRGSTCPRSIHPDRNYTGPKHHVSTNGGSKSHRNSHHARSARPTQPALKSIPEIRFSPASVVALNAKMVLDRPKN